jgi:hypothetical protein
LQNERDQRTQADSRVLAQRDEIDMLKSQLDANAQAKNVEHIPTADAKSDEEKSSAVGCLFLLFLYAHSSGRTKLCRLCSTS